MVFLKTNQKPQKENPMKKIILTLILTGFIFSVPTYAKTEIGGVTLPDTIKVGDETLVLNGGGIREKFWLDMYVGGLYLSQKIIESDQPMAIFMEIVSGMITSERMIEAVEEGFQKSTGGNTIPIQKDIETFINAFREKIQEKDTFLISYHAGAVTIAKNGKEITSFGNLKFKQALFGIWFGNEPADENLKQGMLGVE